MKIKNEDVVVRIIEPTASTKCKSCGEFLVKAQAVGDAGKIKKGTVVYYCYKCQ